MKPEDLEGLFRAAPFVPFTINLSDGKTVLISRPDQAIVGTDFAVVGLNPTPQGRVNGFTTIYLPHVTSIEPVRRAA